MVEREPLSGVDSTWRRLGSADNLTAITGVLSFADEMTYEEVVDVLDRRLLRFDRFKQRIGGRKRRFRRPYWETVEDFDIHNHIYEMSLPEPQDREQLEQFVGTLMSRPLDERRPLWEAYLLREFEGGSALVFRLHHCMADGFALLYVMLGLADNPGDIEFPIDGISVPDPPEHDEPQESTGISTGSTEAVGDGGTQADETNVDENPLEELKAEGKSDSDDPATDSVSTRKLSPDEQQDTSLWSTIRVGGTLAGKGVKTAGRLLFMSDEPETSLHTDIGQTKRAGWTDEMDLKQVKAIAEKCNVTLNTVALAVTAGMFRRTLEQRGEETDDLVVRCTVPVNLKPMDARDESLGNYFGLAFVPIPVGIEDFQKRIEFIDAETDITRLGVESYLMYHVYRLGGWVPESVFDAVLPLFEDSATAVVTNVPGPVENISIAGHEVEKLLFWNPQAVDQGISASIFTYDGGLRVGVSGDAHLVPDPNVLTDAFEDEIEAVADQMGV